MTDVPFQCGSLLLADQNICNVANFDEKFPKIILLLCPPQVKNQVTTTKDSQTFKVLFQKCKKWDLTENLFLFVTSILIDLQGHTVSPFKDRLKINNLFYQIEAMRLKLQSLYLEIALSILFLTPCIYITHNLKTFGSICRQLRFVPLSVGHTSKLYHLISSRHTFSALLSMEKHSCVYRYY